MLCVLCDADGVSTRHYFTRHAFKLSDHFMVTSVVNTGEGKPTYSCKPCRPYRVVFLNPGDAVLHYHKTHEQLVDVLPVPREVPEKEPERELPVLTWELFDQWALRYLALQEEKVQLVVEITSLKGRVEDLTRLAEEQRVKLSGAAASAVSNEFFKVYEDVGGR